MDVEKIGAMPKIFHIPYMNPGHDCYQDPESRLRIYLISQFVEVCQYLSYELRLDKGVYLMIEREISNFGIIHGHGEDLHFEVAGFDYSAAKSEKEAVEFLIEKVMTRVLLYKNNKYDRLAIEMKLRAALLSGKSETCS